VIAAPPSGNLASIAVLVDAGARPLLSKLEIIGGGTGGQSGDVATVGLEVRGNASPEVAAAKITGGSGVSTSGVGSIAVYAHGGSIDVHDSQIDSGAGCTSFPAPAAEVSDAETYLDAHGTSASGNLVLRPTCANSCVARSCSDVGSCARAMFETWDDEGGGLLTMKTSQGLRLAPGGACAVNQGNPAYGAGAQTDFFGAPRTAPFAIGHHEIDTCQ
jgi:hypothetical protein